MCAHLGMQPTRNNRDVAHENGSIEASHGHLKAALAQALLLRGTSGFDGLADYRRFVDEVVGHANARRRKLVEVERAALQPLPPRRTTDHDEVLVTSTHSGGFLLRHVFYIVPSRLIGHRLRVRLYDDRLECLLGSTLVVTLARGRPYQGKGSPNRTLHVVDYRHVIHALRRKPAALLNLVYRDQLFPRDAYRRVWEKLVAAGPPRTACRVMVGLLGAGSRARLRGRAGGRAGPPGRRRRVPDLAALEAQFGPAPGRVPEATVTLPSPALYDAVLALDLAAEAQP